MGRELHPLFSASDSNHSCNISLDLSFFCGIVSCSREREHMNVIEELYYGNIRPSSSRASHSRRVRCDTACTLRGSSSPHRARRVGVPVKPQSVETRKALSEITELEEALGESLTDKWQKK